MDKEAKVLEIQNILEDYLKAQDLQLVELIYRREGRDMALRIFVDRPEGGITIAECSRLNREIADMLEGQDILEEDHILEVSSPGLDRPLKTRSDFLRTLNKPVRFFLNDSVEGRIEHDGIIRNVDSENVHIDKEGKMISIPLSKINKAKQIIK